MVLGPWCPDSCFSAALTVDQNHDKGGRSLYNPLPAPGNGGHPETPLSRLTPNVGENQAHFLPRVPSHMHAQTLSLGQSMPRTIVQPDSMVSPCPDRVHDRRER
eukprot:scaffold2406_cov57-Phaeocystis_antarctica.AAC.2